ncbi:hypothetical protein GRAN_2544 [Granulicella sibirica]|uniref:Uncharacterized protein n=2 Tax=Granulicella sibirica TaxID=2479048 RepID=A0A4Q0SXT8_9BACT|nr:hypothetical protein GRAN_2544 [Granulicella sibirica]
MGKVPAETICAERIQIALAILTLGLLVAEWGIHIYLHGSI